MAASKGEDSKQGLIISLVVSLLLVIILGVTTYFGYQEADKAAKLAADAKKDADSMKADRDFYKTKDLMLEKAVGILPAADAGDEQAQHDRFKSLSGKGKEEFDKSFSQVEASLKNEKTNTPESYIQTLKRLREELVAARADLNKTQDDLKRAKDKATADIASKEDEVRELAEKLKKANETNVADQQAAERALTTRLENLDEASKQLETIKKKYDADSAVAEKQIRRLKEEVKSKDARLVKMETKMTPPDLFKYDVPKGKIVRLDPRGEMAWINVGSSDNVKSSQNLTFSIFGTGQGGRISPTRKGSLEIIDVQGPHLAMAKIIDVVDAGYNPIVAGDVLVNPAWSPDVQMHVAIAGMIDLFGEGRDSIQEFMKTLRRQGVVVDSWLDLRDLSVKGEGMTLKTDYLIKGELPEYDQRLSLKEGDTRLDRKNTITEKITEMQNQATRLGVTVVPLKRFIALTGYRLPRGAGANIGFGYESRPSSPATTDTQDKPAPKNGQKKPEAKKDDDDK